MSHATSPYQTFRKVEEPSRQTSVPPRDGEDSIVFGGYGIEWLNCQEYDCGKGFSSRAHLESHMRFFHPKKVGIIFPPRSAKVDTYEQPTQTTERVKEATVLSNDILDADEKSTGRSPVYFSPTSDVDSPHLGEPTTQGSSGPVETYAPVLPREGYQSSELDAGENVKQTHEGLLELPTTIQDGVDMTPAVTASSPLSLQCRMCDAPPTVGSRPMVTMCGHLFCSEYVLRIPPPWTSGSPCARCITRHVMSTSRCPVCGNALLLYCLFKLDLPAYPKHPTPVNV